MKLKHNLTRILNCITAVSIVVIVGIIVGLSDRATFAEGEHALALGDEADARYVSFYDQGEKLTVKTEANTVGEAIARAGIVINVGDNVEPGLDTEINSDNYHINIYRARPAIVKDGVSEKYIMTASYDYKTVAEEAGLTIYDDDEVKIVPNTSFLETGVNTTYEVVRNGGRTLTIEEEIPFGERTEKDASVPSGTTEVRQLGELGMKRVTYNVFYINNEEVSRERVDEEIIREPVDRVVVVGAKKSIPPEWGSCGEWALAAGVSEADLPAALDLIYHESGCRVDAANPSGAYGIPQALPGSKMATMGADWATNPVTQIKWMINYVNGRYGGWSQALNYWYSHGWY